jgi:hypothetical protein
VVFQKNPLAVGDKRRIVELRYRLSIFTYFLIRETGTGKKTLDPPAPGQTKFDQILEWAKKQQKQ